MSKCRFLRFAAVLALGLSWMAHGAAAGELGDPYSLAGPDYWRGYADNFGRVLATPFDGREVDWQRNGLILGGVVGLFVMDESIQRWSQNARNKGTDRVSKVTNNFGSAYFLVPGLAGTYGIGHMTDDPKLQETGLLGVESLAITSVLVEGSKRIIGRDRPNEPEDKGRPQSGDFNGPKSKKDGSFPSGHTAGAFSVASVVAAEYRDTPAVGITAYGMASLTGLARINDNEHWTSDVAAGAALGTGIGLLVYRFRPWREGETVGFAPGVADRPTGLTMNLRF